MATHEQIVEGLLDAGERLERLGTADIHPFYLTDDWFGELDNLIGEMRHLHGEAARLDAEEPDAREAAPEQPDRIMGPTGYGAESGGPNE